MFRTRKSHVGRHPRKKVRVVGTSQGGSHRGVGLKKETFQKRALRLLKTMKLPDPKNATVRKAARETLSKLIDDKVAEVKNDRKLLFKDRARSRFGKKEIIKLSLIEVKEAELDLIKALFNGAKPGSRKVKILVERARELRKRRKGLLQSR